MTRVSTAFADRTTQAAGRVCRPDILHPVFGDGCLTKVERVNDVTVDLPYSCSLWTTERSG